MYNSWAWRWQNYAPGSLLLGISVSGASKTPLWFPVLWARHKYRRWHLGRKKKLLWTVVSWEPAWMTSPSNETGQQLCSRASKQATIIANLGHRISTLTVRFNFLYGVNADVCSPYINNFPYVIRPDGSLSFSKLRVRVLFIWSFKICFVFCPQISRFDRWNNL